MVKPVPGSLSEGAAERSEAEGVSFVGCSGPMVTRKPLLSLKFLSGYEHQSTPPGLEPGGNIPHNVNHPPAGCFASGRVIFGGSVCGCVLPFIGVLAKIRGYGRFSSPLRNSEMGTFHHSTDDTPSVSHSLDSSLREGAGMGCVPFNVPLGNRKVAGDFRRPYEKFPFTSQAEA